MKLYFNKYLYFFTNISISIVVSLMIIVIPNDSLAHFGKHDFRLNNNDNEFILPHVSNNSPFKIILDAGHGGHDPGCKGNHSIEKDISLKIALKLGQLLTESPYPIEVVYTRKKDVFVPLHERIDIANKADADLFISIHCNSSSNKSASGTESFVMGLHRSEENLEVAKRENQVITLEDKFDQHYGQYDPNSPVGHIILSAFQNIHLEQSLDIAKGIELNFHDMTQKKTRGVKQAGFVVLRNATMPSILIETGFLTNSKDEKFLNSTIGQVKTAKSISTALLNYVKQRTLEVETVATVQESYKQEAPKHEINTAAKKSIATTNSKESKTSETKKIVVVDSKSDVKNFQIQLAATTKKTINIKQGKWKNLKNIQIVKTDKLYKYYTGSYSSKAGAIQEKNRLRTLGFKGAFVVN